MMGSKHLMVVALLAAFLEGTAHSSDKERAPLSMAKIPQNALLVGSTFDEIIATTEACGALRSFPPCVPEEFAAELAAAAESAVSAFYMDRQEVSVEAYERCVAVGHCRPAAYDLGNSALYGAELPVVFVTQRDAARFCASRGARLPTEAEFESAARGRERRTYPWGALFHHDLTNSGTFGREKTSAADGYHLLSPTGSFPQGRTAQGLLHLAGNAAEWTSSPYLAHGSDGPSQLVVVKGGSFAESPVALRAAARRGVSPAERRADIGFRCAMSTAESFLVDPPRDPAVSTPTASRAR